MENNQDELTIAANSSVAVEEKRDEIEYSTESSVATKIEEKIVIKVKGGKCYAFFKRAFDILASGLAIVLLSWLVLILGILVKCTSKGPMIYKSTRVGMGGKEFTIYKFRSMYKDAEQRLKDLQDKNEVEGGVIFKMKDDPRITKFGKFLRKSSLDELPQLFNIFFGHMSVIGPRAGLPCDIFWSIGAPKCPTRSRNTGSSGLVPNTVNRGLDHVTALLGRIFHIEHNVGLNTALLTCGLEH
jgi:lipopolysaccharide/colanic/teichoic acid biosynthesis glycosyltransferase